MSKGLPFLWQVEKCASLKGAPKGTEIKIGTKDKRKVGRRRRQEQRNRLSERNGERECRNKASGINNLSNWIQPCLKPDALQAFAVYGKPVSILILILSV